jgi:poly(3-hydroxybutyrate) depolymerase
VPPDGALGGAPAALAVIDISDTAADLAWKSTVGTTTYRISRAGTDGQFALVGETTSLSFADTGLASQSMFRWHVFAIVNGVEGASSADVTATTRPPQASCDAPGSCPIR